MNSITFYLEKFKKVLTSGIAMKQIVAESVKSVTGRTIDEKDITMRDGNAILRISPALRSTIFMNREKITDVILKQSTKTIAVR